MSSPPNGFGGVFRQDTRSKRTAAGLSKLSPEPSRDALGESCDSWLESPYDAD